MEKDSKSSTAAAKPGTIPAHTKSDRMRIDSRKLFSGAREVIIEHASDEYRLRLTSQGKLILTK